MCQYARGFLTEKDEKQVGEPKQFYKNAKI